MFKSFQLFVSAILLFLILNSSHAQSEKVDFQPSSNSIPVFDFIEISVETDALDVDNPFTDVVFSGLFTHEDQQSIKVDGFCDAEDGTLFKIRFMPRAPGTYQYQLTLSFNNQEHTYENTFEAVPSDNKGPLRLDSNNPWHFVWEGTNEHYFWNGTTTYYLMGWQDDQQIQEIIDRLDRYKINRLRVLVYGRNNDRPWGQPVKTTDEFKLYLNPWPAENPDNIENPEFDLTRFNVDHWQKYERLLAYAREKDIIVSVIFFIGGQIYPTPFEAYSNEEDLFYRYGIARLAAFSNVTWDLGNEHNFHREVSQWVNHLGPKVKEWDPYDHLASAHNVVYHNTTDEWIDLQLIQRWDSGQNHQMLEYREQQKATGRIIPQVNEEYGYEDLWEKYPDHREADTRRRLAWEIYMAGCYQTTGETAERGTGFPPDSGGGWVNGRGDDSMTMLQGYENMVDFFTTVDWWKAQPANDRVNAGAFCLADPQNFYIVYLPSGDPVTIQLDDSQYQARFYNCQQGEWIDLSQANGPVWTSPTPESNEDWALLLTYDQDQTDRTPPEVRSVSGNSDTQEITVVFSEQIDPQSIENIENFQLNPATNIVSAEMMGEYQNTVVLKTDSLEEQINYTITIQGIRDRSPQQNTMPSQTQTFTPRQSANALVLLHFNERQYRKTKNTGLTSDEHEWAIFTDSVPKWSTNTPPNGGAGSIDFGVNDGNYAVDLNGGVVDELKGLKSFTLTGWVNCRSNEVGPGGNRIITNINNGGDGFDLVYLQSGALQIGINEWPDGSPARSNNNRIPVDENAPASNWRFFAVTYDSTAENGQVKFYFAEPDESVILDRTVNYNQGASGFNTGPLTIGHFNLLTRPNHTDRMFRGQIDEISVIGSTVDQSGALTHEEINEIYRSGTLSIREWLLQN